MAYKLNGSPFSKLMSVIGDLLFTFYTWKTDNMQRACMRATQTSCILRNYKITACFQLEKDVVFTLTPQLYTLRNGQVTAHLPTSFTAHHWCTVIEVWRSHYHCKVMCHAHHIGGHSILILSGAVWGGVQGKLFLENQCAKKQLWTCLVGVGHQS